jgi:integrase
VASIRNRAGRWRVQIRRKGSPNQFKSFATKAEALAWSRQIECEMDRGAFISRAEAERTTLAEILERYRRDVTPAKASADREALCLALLKRHLGAFYLSRLTSREIASYRDYRLSLGLAGATVVKELNTLSHVIDTARCDWGIFLAENPVKLVRRPKVAPGRDRRLREGELHKLLTACAESRSPALSVIVQLAIETGMRLGECFRWSGATSTSTAIPLTSRRPKMASLGQCPSPPAR